MKKLTDLLAIPRFSGLRLLTDKTSTQKPVESIEITETPDIAHYIPEKTFILTTAMVYKDNQKELFPLIDSLVAKNASGLGIKIGRFLDTVDIEVIAYAQTLGFPIVEIPATIPLGRLMHQLLNVLWNTKTEQLSYALDIQKRFSSSLINDVSIARFIADFGQIVNTPIILLNPFKKVIAHSKHFTKMSKPAEYYIHELTKKIGVFTGEKSGTIPITDLNQKTSQISYFAIETSSYFPYYLVVLNPEAIPFPVSEFAIEQAALVLSFMLYKNQKVQESLEDLKTEFLTRMIEYQQSTKQQQKDWLDLGKTFGLVKARHYRVIYVACQPTEITQATKVKYQKEESELAYQWFTEQLPHRIKDTCLFNLKGSNHFAILVQHKCEQLEADLTETADALAACLPFKITFGVGTVYESINDLASSFIEAKTAYEERKSQNSSSSVTFYHQKGMRSLFEKMSPEDIHYFCRTILKELAFPQEDALIELRKTLRYYLDFQCEITRTAKALFVHRNTIKYRIEQCQKLLGKNVHDPAVSLDLRLALELSEEGD
ncbi:PucR family transcriptional regulator ligand-binding domain-containing protein [Enterococcus sp. BWB1-3]|uniref:PucR family transcriptional regulator n=1 Tax=unclassified Enterococcus TaxID=2608891 RepID=UPI00192156A1|nr:MULTISPECIES: PucR family transcriptional regulator [unclassified Enterococcus]MBL1228400.1 PucR family transcriptional regulator ligand-binding domain-containing protein [Enterococcus sp. BWB1-3]MCB5951215.1 PucR family transcriptional regulator ligand-binding domain-containing protein [Enterococcus sp. BWT-B8]MCB5954840.1 PucR family transcriptional regulator ligand-binding domain-containing protein [Enterococcus sp. CWB-B31]